MSFFTRFRSLWKISAESSVYVGFIDGPSHHTQNSASVAWVIYTRTGQVLSSGGICLQPSPNNVVEYSVMIDLLCDAISHGVHSVEVHLALQLVVSQLNGLYHVTDPTLLQRFLCGILLERKFESITYIHIPRNFNQVPDSYANYVLDWHLFHRS